MGKASPLHELHLVPPAGCSAAATGSSITTSNSSAAVAARPVSGFGSDSSRPPTAPFLSRHHWQARRSVLLAKWHRSSITK